MNSKHKNRTLYFSAILLLLIAGLSNSGWAENRWILHKSSSGIFNVRIPNEYETANEKMHVSSETFAQTGELISTIDQRPYKNVSKNYIVKYEQTLGPALSKTEREAIIDYDLDLYAQHYEALGGIVQERVTTPSEDNTTGELYITYEDPSMGEQGVRAFITFTDVSKFQQILTGPLHIMHSFESKDFFQSLDTKEGRIKAKTKLDSTWIKHDSPFKTFSLSLPPVSEVFHPHEPRIEHNDHSEVISSYFYDPVRKQQLFYKVYGYRRASNLSAGEAKKVMYFKHAAKYLKTPRSLEYKTARTEDNVSIIETEYSITPPKGYPYIQTVKLRGLFKGPYMIVQEVMSSDALANAEFTRTLTDLVAFTPERAHQARQAKAQ